MSPAMLKEAERKAYARRAVQESLRPNRSSSAAGPMLKDFFNLNCQSNPRKLTPLHRAVISGNYHAIKMILESPLFLDALPLSPSLSK